MVQRTWPESASRSIVADFYKSLLKLENYDLNHLDIKTYPKWARRVMDSERQRRAKNGPILTFSAEGIREEAVVQARTPKKVDRSAPPEDVVDEPKLPEFVNFYSNLLNLDLNALNRLSVTKYPAWARQTVDVERQQREQGGSAPPSKSQRATVLTIGETGTQKDVPLETHTPKEVDESTTPEDVDGEPKWPEVADRSMVGTFYSKLLKLNQDDFYRMSKAESPKWVKRVVNAELRRRKKSGSSPPTKAQRAAILNIGETDWQKRTVPTAKASGSKKKADLPKMVDGSFLHQHVANYSSYRLEYDNQLTSNTRTNSRSISIRGSFRCKTRECNYRKWETGIVATVLEFSAYNQSYKTTLYFQACQVCDKFAKPSVDPERYAEKIIWVIDLWTGRRESEKQPQYDGPKGPHDEDRCYGCKVGACTWAQ